MQKSWILWKLRASVTLWSLNVPLILFDIIWQFQNCNSLKLYQLNANSWLLYSATIPQCLSPCLYALDDRVWAGITRILITARIMIYTLLFTESRDCGLDCYSFIVAWICNHSSLEFLTSYMSIRILDYYQQV